MDGVCDEYNCQWSALLDFQKFEAQRVAGEGIECCKRFVHEQNFRIVDQGPGERETLLHLARELVGRVLFIIVELDEVEQLFCFFLNRIVDGLTCMLYGEEHIVPGG